ncbi:MAG: RagB/SusD family nutrient uptake outer membrane protein, partial [Bacteroidaceae bacterium]|nr:RagB/SusD family nutrient uptake outer membrane protein [Bacteroidaceae bacterium]
PLMRIEEMYLIQAEATAMAGDAANGKTLLTDFVKTYRDPSYTTKAASAEEVQLAVWNQRRIELWGEGLSYFDILRLQQPIDRRGAGFEEGYVYYIEPGEGILIYQIPKVETEANKQIDGLKDNNPIPSVPDPVQE